MASTVNTTQSEVLAKYPQINTRMLLNLTNMLYDSNVKVSLEEIRDAFSTGQLASKLWLVDELSKLGLPVHLKIMVLGGWFGTLPALLFNHYKWPNRISRICSVDIDPQCEIAADYLNMEEMLENWRFKAFTADMFEINYNVPIFRDKLNEIHFHYDTVINTSCEHIKEFKKWIHKIPSGKLVVLQNNNFDELEDHVNCVKNIDEFEQQCGLIKVLYKGVLECQKYDRYMLIGYR